MCSKNCRLFWRIWVLNGVHVARSLVFCVVFWRSLSFFLWSLCCLTFNLRFTVTPFGIFKLFLTINICWCHLKRLLFHAVIFTTETCSVFSHFFTKFKKKIVTPTLKFFLRYPLTYIYTSNSFKINIQLEIGPTYFIIYTSSV